MKYRVGYVRKNWTRKDDSGEERTCALVTDNIEKAEEMATQEIIMAESDMYIAKDAVLEELAPDGTWQLIAKWPDW